MKEYMDNLCILEKNLERNLETAPKGFARVTGSKDHKVIYWVEGRPDSAPDSKRKDRYLKESEKDIKCQLMQKSYDQKLLCRVKSDIAVMSTCLEEMSDGLDDVYDSLSDIRKSFVTPYRLDDAAYAEQWTNRPYKPKSTHPEDLKHTTLLGETVRSKSERSIADLLTKYNIRYKYEAPLYLEGLGWIHPDFTILDMRTRRNVYWEHLGKMGDLDYVNAAIKRVTSYTLNGYVLGRDLLITMETLENPLDQPEICRIIENNLLGKL